MDDFLKDLQSWKNKRDEQHADPSVPQEESKAAQAEDNRFMLKLEDEFMRKADERQRQIADQLRAMDIDPEAPPEEESKFGFQLPQIEAGMKNSDYVDLMAQIEAKERELAQKEEEAMREAYEHIELTEGNKAQAEARKLEL